MYLGSKDRDYIGTLGPGYIANGPLGEQLLNHATPFSTCAEA